MFDDSTNSKNFSMKYFYCFQVTVWYMMPVGLSVGTSTRIGNSLGAGKADDAATYAKLGFLTALLYALLNGCIFVLFLRRAWNSMFSEDAAVLQLLNSVFPVLFFYGVFDATKCVMMGVLRGAGRPSVTVWGNTLACVLVGAPLSYLFAFHVALGLRGLWIGMACAWLAATAVYAFVVFRRTDWQTEVVAAAQRNESSLQSRNLSGELP
jgi:MATE family multidrug resistance protein